MAGGRPPGTPNKLGAQARNALWEAYNKLGGLQGLVRFGEANPEAFYKLWAKLIPNDMRIELAVEHTIRRNFTGRADEIGHEAAQVIEGEARVVSAIPSHRGDGEEVEIDRSNKLEGHDDGEA